MEIKLLVLDMDGTTYYKGGEIVPANVKPIQTALKQGVEVVIVTGRPALAPQNKLVENGFAFQNAIIAACNGACIYDFVENKLLKSSSIQGDQAQVLFDLIAKFPEVELWGYVDNLTQVVHTRNDHHTSGWEFESHFFQGEYLWYQDVKSQINQMQFFKFLAFDVSQEFLQAMQELNFETALSASDQTLEINAQGINKAFAVKWIAQQLNITPDQIMSIGDGMNDLPMIEYASHGVALKNSVAAVQKAAAIHIDKTNVEGGVAEAINQYILKK